MRTTSACTAVSLALSACWASGQTLVSPDPQVEGRFGWAVAAVPDVNGDGRPEVAVGGPWENYGGKHDAGRVYLYSHTGVRRLTISSPSPQPSGVFGFALTGIPDVNGDGRGDIGVGGSSDEGGVAYVVSGFSGAVRLTLLPSEGFSPGNFGAALTGLADVTGDGRGDIAVAAPDAGEIIPPHDFHGPSKGRVYIFNGFTGALVHAFGSSSPNGTDSRFGAALARVPDTDGDGREDIAIGAPMEQVGAKSMSGRVYIFSASTGLRLRTLWSPHAGTAGFFGASVAGVPDLDGDGRGEVLVGAPNESIGNAPDGAGRAYLFSGKTGALLRQLTIGNPEFHDNFGSAVSSVPDVNGDGRADVVIGALGKASRAGRIYIYSGATGAFLRAYASPNQEADGEFGTSIAGLPDFNGDGKGDIAVTGPGEDAANRTDAGRAYLIRY